MIFADVPGRTACLRLAARGAADWRRVVKIFVLSGRIALASQSADALELKVGDRIPAVSGEVIIVVNDGGLKLGTQLLDFGQVCRINGWTKNWLLVRRIVADWTLIELVGPSPGEDPIIDYPSSLAEECPLGTETTKTVTEMKARLNQYAKQTDSEFTESLLTSPTTKSARSNSHGEIGIVANGIPVQESIR